MVSLIAATFFSRPFRSGSQLRWLSFRTRCRRKWEISPSFLESGYSAARAFLLNLVSGASRLVGALLAYVWLPHLHSAVPYFMALAAAGFVYVAMADLVPGCTAAPAQNSAPPS